MSIGKTYCPVYCDTEYVASAEFVKKDCFVKVSATPKLENFKPYEVTFRIENDLLACLVNQGAEEPF